MIKDAVAIRIANVDVNGNGKGEGGFGRFAIAVEAAVGDDEGGDVGAKAWWERNLIVGLAPTVAHVGDAHSVHSLHPRHYARSPGANGVRGEVHEWNDGGCYLYLH